MRIDTRTYSTITLIPNSYGSFKVLKVVIEDIKLIRFESKIFREFLGYSSKLWESMPRRVASIFGC